MVGLVWAILVGLLLTASTPGFSTEKDPEFASPEWKQEWKQKFDEIGRQAHKLEKRKRDICAKHFPSWGELHCETFHADHFFRTDRDAPEWKAFSPLQLRFAERVQREGVKILLEEGADPNAQDASGETPLHIVARGSGDPELLAVLLTGGANPNLLSKRDISPLFWAAMRDDLAAVELLLHYGADKTVNVRVNAADEALRGFTALHYAALRGRPEIVKALLRVGADPFAEVHGRTALDLADIGRKRYRGSVVKHYETIKIIRQAQAMIRAQMKGGQQKRRKPRLRLQPL